MRPDSVSVASDGTEGNGESRGDGESVVRSISSDGRFVAFSSEASNLISGDTNEVKDVFVHDRQTTMTERISVASGGTEANGESGGPSISSDGRFVAFYSRSSNLVAGDTNGEPDVFVHDRQTEITERVSVASDGTQSDNGSGEPGRGGPSISSDGRFVAFGSNADNLVPGVIDEFGRGIVYVHDRQTRVTQVASVDNATGEPFGFGSNNPSINADGRFVAFEGGTLDIEKAVYVHDRETGETEMISGGQDYGYWSLWPSISDDGRFVAFQSESPNLVPNDTNEAYDVFVHDRQTGITERVSVASDGTQANDKSWHPSMSGDARFVAFISYATNLVPGDTNWGGEIFVHDRQTGVTKRVSVASDGTEANNESGGPKISGNGGFVAFDSWASNLVPGDTNEAADVFVACNPLSQHQFIEIEIDIKPGSFPNSINPESSEVIPVAILTTDTLDATTVDPTTVLFGLTGTEAAPVQSALEDVDGDGDTDMILHFKTQDTDINCGDTSASLTGETFSGQAIEGSDSIQTPSCPCVQPPAGLVSWWPGDGIVNDIIDGNDGSLEGGATFALGKVGQAFLLDGIDDFVDAGNAPNLHVSEGDFTVDAWVFFNALAHPPGANIIAPQGDMSIVDKMSTSAVNGNIDGWRLLKQDDNRFYFCLGGGESDGCNDPAFTVYSTTVPMTGVWFHVAAVKSAASFSIYVNGQLEDSRSPVPSFLDTQSANLLIGSNALEGSHLNGMIDEVEILNRALSTAEVQAIFLAGSKGKCKVGHRVD
jgi:Tol biopolymer transport system component